LQAIEIVDNLHVANSTTPQDYLAGGQRKKAATRDAFFIAAIPRSGALAGLAAAAILAFTRLFALDVGEPAFFLNFFVHCLPIMSLH